MQGVRVRSLVNLARSTVQVNFQRNLGVGYVAAQKVVDPIQKLFADKLKEYSQKSKSSGNKLFEASPEIQKEYDEDLKRIEKQFGGGKGVDLTKFPAFRFEDPKIDPINLEKK
ncbi:Atpsyn-cf6p [Chamberlinius hualienensis]